MSIRIKNRQLKIVKILRYNSHNESISVSPRGDKAEIAHWKAKASQKIKSPHYPRAPHASPLGLKETERTDTRVNF